MGKRYSLPELKKLGMARKESTDKARAEKRERRAERVSTFSGADVPDLKLDFSDCGQTPEQVLNSYHVQSWFREGITRRIRWSVTLPLNDDWWRGKQRFLAKKLLAAFEGELVKKAIFYLCDNWEEMVKGSAGRLTGIPTIELLWASRDRIFADAERGRPYVSPTKRTMRHPSQDSDEYKDVEDDAVGHGW